MPLRRRRDRRAVGELLRARHDDALAGLEAVEHRVVVADDRPDLDRALPRDERRLAVRPLRLFGDEREILAVDAQRPP